MENLRLNDYLNENLTKYEKISYETLRQNANPGYQQLIDTLTYTLKKVSEQKFYEISLADYVPMNVQDGAWSSNILSFRTQMTGGDFKSGIINMGENKSKLATVDAAIDAVSTPTLTWSKEINWVLPEVMTAAQTGVLDVVEVKEKARKKDWDLGLQKIIIEGDADYKVQGLANLDGVTSNATLIAKPISQMDKTEFQAFLSGLIPAYRQNCNFTAQPNIFVIPEMDYNGLGAAADETYPLKSKLERMLEVLKVMTNNPDFKILPLAYTSKAVNGSKNTYMLYRYDEDSIRVNIPVDYTAIQGMSFNGFQFQSIGYGQFTGVTLLRPKEMLYFTNAV